MPFQKFYVGHKKVFGRVGTFNESFKPEPQALRECPRRAQLSVMRDLALSVIDLNNVPSLNWQKLFFHFVFPGFLADIFLTLLNVSGAKKGEGGKREESNYRTHSEDLWQY